MTSKEPKDPWRGHLRENWVLIAVFLLMLMILVWKPFRSDLETDLPPELIGIEGNLHAREVLERLQQEGGGRLYPPRGYGGLAPHQGTGGPVPEPPAPDPQTSGQ